jgi:glycosyltransferase involved in cell wall biosynthesis
MGGPRFTVFTATFNRAHTLPRVHRSLSAQTFRDFEWLIVDDGSTDGTRQLVAEWAASSPFPIRYVLQENGGKAAATNHGVGLAAGELFLMADSDDEFVPTALERFAAHWDAIPGEARDGFTGVTARCCDCEGRPLGDRLPRDPLDSDSLEIFYRYGVRGEQWGFHRTDVIRSFPFPLFEGMRHTPEDVVWRAIARRYKTRFVNDVLRVYHQDAGAQLTRIPARRWAEFRGYYAQRMLEDVDWMRIAPLQFYRLMVHYARWCFVAADPLSLQVRRLHAGRLRALWVAAAVPGLLLAGRDRVRDVWGGALARRPAACPGDRRQVVGGSARTVGGRRLDRP